MEGDKAVKVVVLSRHCDGEIEHPCVPSYESFTPSPGRCASRFPIVRW